MDNPRKVNLERGFSLVAIIVCLPSLLLAQPNWEAREGYRAVRIPNPTRSKPGFSALDPQALGVDFVNRLALSTSLTNQIYLNGSGVAVADVNGDDLLDLYFCGLESANQLYLNQGNWKFEPSSASPAISCLEQASTGTAFADVDGDGDPDLLVNGIRAGTRLFLNGGTGIFTEVTDAWGLRNRHGSASMAIADVNGDGWLDLYVVNYRNETLRDEPDSPFDVRMKEGEYELVSYRGRPASAPDLVGRFTFDRNAGVMENGEADQLYLNEGGKRFRAVSWDEGIFMGADRSPASAPYDWGLSAMFRDLNGDLWPDLYVCNDFQSPDRIWINDGTGSFSPIWETAVRQTSLFSMGLDVADIDRDGYDDIFVVDMLSRSHQRRHTQVMDTMAFAQYRAASVERPQSPRNTLLYNRGDGDYAEIARLAGVDASDWSWSPAFLDVDLDGYEDLLITTGHGRDAQNVDISRQIDEEIQRQKLTPADQLALRSRYPKLNTKNVAFRNEGNLQFSEAGDAWEFNSEKISHGLVLADLDNDGDQDVVMTCLNDRPLILKNNVSAPRLRVLLEGGAPNQFGIGANITVRTADFPTQSQEVIGGGRYLSSESADRVFALKSSSSSAMVEVKWRDGTVTNLRGVGANQIIKVSKTPSVDPNVTSVAGSSLSVKPMFRDVSHQLPFRHVDQPFNATMVQSSLPHKVSELGPGVAWFDFNADGWEDLFFGAGRGGKLGVYRNAKDGSFVRQKAQAFAKPVQRDHGLVMGWQRTATDRVLLMAQTNYEDALPRNSALRQFSVVNGQGRDDFIVDQGNYAVLAQADIDGDDDLDLFVGGTYTFGKYPEASRSVILNNNRGQLFADGDEELIPDDLGAVQSARFANITGDSNPELLVAARWKPLRILQRVGGKYRDWDPELVWRKDSAQVSTIKRLSDLSGWWNSVEAGDFDGDGDLDIVAGNAGRNYFRPGYPHEGRRLYFPRHSVPGQGVVEAYLDRLGSDWLPITDFSLVQKSFPAIRNTASSFTEFGRMTMTDMLQAGLADFAWLEVSTMGSVILLNQENRLEVSYLPVEAQFAPIHGVGVNDFDCDGHLDLVLNQNDFGSQLIFGRQDAGTVLLLSGSGDGQFSTRSSKVSGLRAYGQGRGLALCDFNHDGRMDFVSAQSNAPAKMFVNQSARRGIRVVIKGEPSNPKGIGVSLRIRYQDSSLGPVQDVTSGSGYWSQNSSTLVLGYSGPPKAVVVEWPDGRRSEVSIPAGALEITCSSMR